MDAKGYRDLIESYVKGKISTLEFENMYLKAFKNEPNTQQANVFRIISEMFCDVDAYSPIWETKDEDGISRITEKTLYNRAAQSLMKLNDFLESTSKETIN